MKEDAAMPVITFIGPTGVGKSSIIQFFCEKGKNNLFFFIPLYYYLITSVYFYLFNFINNI